MTEKEKWASAIQKAEAELLSDIAEQDRPDTDLAHTLIEEEVAHTMTASDISSFIEIAAQSQQCKPSDISFYYEPIINDDGNVLLDVLLLIFSIKMPCDGFIQNRPIHTIRVSVPQEVQQRARAMIEATLSKPE